MSETRPTHRPAVWAVFFLVLGLTACDKPAAPLQANEAPQQAAATATAHSPRGQLDLGRAVYNFRCYYCHGYSGDAKTLAATYLTPPPRDFQTATPQDLPLEKIRAVVRDGRTGTAMKPFAQVIPKNEIEAVAAFVFDEFVMRKQRNTRYHTAENGWPNHERYAEAFPFALGEIALDVAPETLTAPQQRGRALYVSSCITCHDRGRPTTDATIWDSRPLSFPRFNYDHRKPEVDAATSATPYRLHDIPPVLPHLNAKQKHGETLFQANCAFCHAADGTGKNWIGAFLEPHPRNLTDPTFMRTTNQNRLAQTIRNGVPNTSMPAWKDVLSAEEIDALIAYIDVAFHPVPK